jgi:uncharacterized coiled-coil protein SlyX
MNDITALSDRLLRLEELFSHQQHLLQQLNEELIKLRNDYDIHKSRFQDRMQDLETRLDESGPQPDPTEKPPHY